MTAFSCEFNNVLYMIRRVDKRLSDTINWAQHCDALTISNKVLRKMDDVERYQWASVLCEQLNTWVSEQGMFLGIDACQLHIQALLDRYSVEDQHVIHPGQQASRALVQVIQLVGLPKSKHNQNIYDKIQSCISMVVSKGNQEQYRILVRALQSSICKNELFFTRQINALNQYMRKRQVYNMG